MTPISAWIMMHLFFDCMGYSLLSSSWIHVLKLCNSIEEKFPYLVQKQRKEGQEIRRVAQMAWNIITDDCNQPFFASGLKFTPLPVNYTIFFLILRMLYSFYMRTLLFFVDVGNAWRGLHLFGISFWWEK